MKVPNRIQGLLSRNAGARCISIRTFCSGIGTTEGRESGKRKALVGNTSLCHLATLPVHAESLRSRYPKGKIV